MSTNVKRVLIDIDQLSELEYGGYLITRVEPQYFFYVITAVDGTAAIATALKGKWTSPKEAMAAIDAVKRRR